MGAAARVPSCNALYNICKDYARKEMPFSQLYKKLISTSEHAGDGFIPADADADKFINHIRKDFKQCNEKCFSEKEATAVEVDCCMPLANNSSPRYKWQTLLWLWALTGCNFVSCFNSTICSIPSLPDICTVCSEEGNGAVIWLICQCFSLGLNYPLASFVVLGASAAVSFYAIYRQVKCLLNNCCSLNCEMYDNVAVHISSELHISSDLSLVRLDLGERSPVSENLSSSHPVNDSPY